MAFEWPAECERAEGDIPDALIDFFEADIGSDADVCNVDPLMVPPEAPVGADITHLEAVRVLKRRQLMSHRPGGGGIAGGGCAHIERLVRALAVARLAEAIKLERLSPPSAGGRACGLCLQRARPAFMATVLLGLAGFDARGEDPQADPPGLEL
jgi:hypothetical protein